MKNSVLTRNGTSLSASPAGTDVNLRSVGGGGALAARLASMGLVPGARMHVQRNEGHGPVVLRVHGARILLGRGMAEKVVVRPVEGGRG